ncbi:hypothetical protein EZV62_004490 [Acer yangbiense]|uniref:Uncharacterized protein n=1 Tax=Acer yangbiense TaxID=1000413 RepID=A0A5C7IK75_9ROSI|nr:hypothetical protein EZV62_004490 [Acer yangbiense]
MAEAAVTVATEIAAEHVVDSISTQLGYIWNYKTNFENLEGQHRKLKDTLAQVQHSVDEATRNGEEIEQRVLSWLDRVETINKEATMIIDDNQRANVQCFRNLCPDLKKRYQHSKNAANKADDVSKLEIEGNSLGKVSYRTPPKETWHPSSKLYQDIESRRSTVENILNALRDPDINMVGVHGMGGIGKTMLAKEVGKQAEEQRLFDALVFVEVSEKPDIRKIQGAIADKLGLKFHEETESGRARALCERCKKDSKLLIILDNIWKGLDLEIVGIPFANDHPGCKLLLTARSVDVLSNDMNSLKNFPVGELDEKEAWDLFKTAAGACIEQPNLQSLAFEVAKRCGGLPIAIITIAKALKDKQEHEWKNALRELKRPSLDNLVGSVTAKAYSCIWLSYNQLNSDELKSTFLLCCIMAFTSNASFEELLRYGMGLSLFRTIYTMEEAWDKVNTLVKKLKDSSLLLDTPDGEGFSIHDVVRDVGRAIAINDHNKYTVNDDRILQQDLAGKNKLKNCTYIILHDIAELPEELDCLQLEFLYVKPKTRFHKIPDKFFTAIPKLGVLHLIEMDLSPLPTSFHLLKKLQTLHMDRCHLGDIAEIGYLKNLKILVALGSRMERLPEQIGELNRLMVLDLSKCYDLQVIPPNTISRLTQLEELYMPGKFCKWQGVDGERSNAGLGELEHLSQLTALQIYIPDPKLVPKGLLFQKLQRYKIYIGNDGWGFGYDTSRKLVLKYDDANISVEDGIIKQLREIEGLQLIGKQGVKNVLYELNRDGFPKLKHFVVERNPELVYIVDFPKQSEPCVAFPHLQTLSFYRLSSLEKICHGQFSSPYSFCQLRTLDVQICVKLKNIFSSSIARHLSQLERISVFSCENMEEIFSIVGSENEEIVLEKLESLHLEYLRKLRSFTYDEERQMKGSLMPLFDGKVKFRNLKTIYLGEINLKYVFSSSTLGSFVQLQRLDIHWCSVLEEIIRIDDLKNNVELPSLKYLGITKCPAMKSFIFSDKVTFPSLEEIEISDMDNLEMIWHNQLEDSHNFQYCQKLCKISLKDIYVEECGIKEIIAKEEAGDRTGQYTDEIELDWKRYYCDGDVNTTMERIHEKEVVIFKVRKFRKGHKPIEPEKDLENKPVVQEGEQQQPKNENGGGPGGGVGDDLNKSPNSDLANDVEDDDDDFITNEVKRRLKELRRNSFMVLIPEEEEEEEVGETSSSEWRDVEAEGRRWWGGFDAVYEKYCEWMLFFDRMSAQQLNVAGSLTPSTPSPKSASKKLASPFRCLSLKKIEQPEEETENLQQPENDPYQDLETAYELQQFQVLLQRFIENEPFEQGLRPEIYARNRNLFPKLLQVPNIQGSAQKEKTEEEESDSVVLATDLMRIIESSILTLHLFVKIDKKRSGGVLNLFGNQSQIATPLHQVQSLLVEKGTKLKELRKRRKGWKKKSWPQTWEDIELLFGLIDIKVMSRVLRMSHSSSHETLEEPIDHDVLVVSLDVSSVNISEVLESINVCVDASTVDGNDVALISNNDPLATPLSSLPCLDDTHISPTRQFDDTSTKKGGLEDHSASVSDVP